MKKLFGLLSAVLLLVGGVGIQHSTAADNATTIDISLDKSEAIAGQYFSASVSATGGTYPYGMSVSSGSLPPGLSLMQTAQTDCFGCPAGGPMAIQGTPSQPGTYKFSITATDTHGASSSEPFTIVVGTGSETVMAVTAPAAGETWALGSTHTITWSSPSFFAPTKVTITLNGTLPSCLYTSPQCAIKQVAPYTIATSVTNTSSYQWTVPELASTFQGDQQISVAIDDTNYRGISAPFVIGSSTSTGGITTSDSLNGQVGKSFQASFFATGGVGSYSWAVTSGSLPPGLALYAAVCIVAPCQAPVDISGTPTQAGNYTFTLSNGGSSKQFTIVISGAGATALTVTSPNGGETWVLKNSQTIRWSAPASVQSVDIYLDEVRTDCSQACTARASFRYTIAQGVSNTGSYPWTVGYDYQGASIYATTYTMRIQDHANANTVDSSDSYFKISSDATDVICHEGQNVKYSNAPTVYYIKNCKKEAYSSAAMFYAWNTSFGSVSTIATSETYPDNGFVKLPNNIVVKSPTNPTVYLVDQSRLYPFASAAALFSRGFNFAQIKVFSDADLRLHEFGGALY